METRMRLRGAVAGLIRDSVKASFTAYTRHSSYPIRVVDRSVTPLFATPDRRRFKSTSRMGGGKGGKGGRGGKGGGKGGKGGGGGQRWWDPVWRRERLAQMRENGHGGKGRVQLDEENIIGQLTALVNSQDPELQIRENYGRDGSDQIVELASQMGLYSRSYGKGRGTVLVVSKQPLPNYRADLDDQQESRQVEMSDRTLSLVNGALDVPRAPPGLSRVARRSGSGPPSMHGKRPAEEGPEGAQPVRARVSPESASRQPKPRPAGPRVLNAGAKEMLPFREKLPAFRQRQDLVAAVRRSQVVVVSGETGCGKTTQLPQYILESEEEAGRGGAVNIICTQPRRISAISVAQRVAQERGEELGQGVGYQIRLESRRSEATRLLFCTTGVLLRRLVHEPALAGVTHVIVDEIHERGMNEDFLLIVLRDLLPARPDLRLILMSATLNAHLFADYFASPAPAPTFHIPGFTFPVRDIFLEEFLEKSRYRITASSGGKGGGGGGGKGRSKGGRKGGPSGVPQEEGAGGPDDVDICAEVAGQVSGATLQSLGQFQGSDKLNLELVEAVVEYICRHEEPPRGAAAAGAVLVFLTGWDDICKLNDKFKAHPLLGDPSRTRVLPLHGSMPTVTQREIFARPPAGVRKVVLATNIAETSITIDDVVYVVDCGKSKEKTYDALNQLACLEAAWVSQANARQRRGRAGRVQAGQCFKLYTAAQHDAMAEYQVPELLRTPLEELCLQIKALGLGAVRPFLARALQPPEERTVENALARLRTIGALDPAESLTALGRHLATLPVDPGVGKMMLMGAVFGVLDPVLTIAAGMAHRDPFVLPIDKKAQADEAKRRLAAGQFSDHLAVLEAFEGWKRARSHGGGAWDYVRRNFLSDNTLCMMDDMRGQFYGLLADIGFVQRRDEGQGRPGEGRGQPCNANAGDMSLVRAVLVAGLYPNVVAVTSGKRRAKMKTKEDGKVECHPGSVLANEGHFPQPWLVYNEKVKTTGIYLRDATMVSDFALLLFGGELERAAGPGVPGWEQLAMGEGYLRFEASAEVAGAVHALRARLDALLQAKISSPNMDIAVEGGPVVKAVRALLSEAASAGPSHGQHRRGAHQSSYRSSRHSTWEEEEDEDDDEEDEYGMGPAEEEDAYSRQLPRAVPIVTETGSRVVVRDAPSVYREYGNGGGRGGSRSKGGKGGGRHDRRRY